MISKFLMFFLLLTTFSAWATKDDHDAHLKMAITLMTSVILSMVLMILRKAGMILVMQAIVQLRMLVVSIHLILSMIVNFL